VPGASLVQNRSAGRDEFYEAQTWFLDVSNGQRSGIQSLCSPSPRPSPWGERENRSRPWSQTRDGTGRRHVDRTKSADGGSLSPRMKARVRGNESSCVLGIVLTCNRRRGTPSFCPLGVAAERPREKSGTRRARPSDKVAGRDEFQESPSLRKTERFEGLAELVLPAFCHGHGRMRSALAVAWCVGCSAWPERGCRPG
jgi:hypothetical protein